LVLEARPSFTLAHWEICSFSLAPNQPLLLAGLEHGRTIHSDQKLKRRTERTLSAFLSRFYQQIGESLLQQSGIFFVGVRQHPIAVAWLR